MNIYKKKIESLRKNEEKTNYTPSKFWMGYTIYLAPMKPIFMAASVVRGANEMPLKSALNNEQISMM